jgi:hypothetical protein
MIKKLVFSCVVILTLFMGVMTIKYGIEERWRYAYMCSSSCSLNLLSTFMVWRMIRQDTHK